MNRGSKINWKSHSIAYGIMFVGDDTITRLDLRSYLIISLLAFSIWIVFIIPSTVSAVEFYSKNDAPFGTTYDEWIGKWWNWWFEAYSGGKYPEEGGCMINTSEPLIMLMDTAISGKPLQKCVITSSQGIMFPLWTGEFEDSLPEYNSYTYDQLSKGAREEINLGAVTSVVKVDGTQIAKLDEVSSMKLGSLDYKINSMDNVTEVYSKGFNITIPEDSNIPDLKPGTWRAGAHGWFVFMKPLPPGDHMIYYNVGVTGLGPNDHSAEITYDLKVK
jgi:hypothetical protein